MATAPYRTAQGHEVSLAEVTRVCDGRDKAYPALAELRDRYRKRKPWEVTSALGRRMADKTLTKGEPGVHHSGAQARLIPSTNALNWPNQSSGAELLKEALALLVPRLWTELPGARLCHLVHDEILLEVPEAMADQAAALLADGASDDRVAAELGVPVDWVQGLQGSLPVAAEVVHQQWRRYRAHGQRIRSLVEQAMDVVEAELAERPTPDLAVALLRALKVEAPLAPLQTAEGRLLPASRDRSAR